MRRKFHNHRFREFPRGLRVAARENVRWRARRCSTPSGTAIFAPSFRNLSSAWNETTRIEDEAIRAAHSAARC
jgi:hypothetical protein